MKGTASVVPFYFPELARDPKIFRPFAPNIQGTYIQLIPRRLASRGCSQWVLAAACEAVEWPNQPLGFDSLTLCCHSTKILDFAVARVILKMLRRRHLVPNFKSPG